MKSSATTVASYLASLPADRRAAIETVRKVILENLDDDYEEGIQYGMIGYYVPHRVFPAGYHCDPRQPLPFASIASQKNHMAVYLMCIYGSPEHEAWFRKAWKAAGRKLDMGKSCVRFKKVDDLALDVLGEAIRRVPAKAFVEHYETTIRSMGKRKAAEKGKPAPSARAASTKSAKPEQKATAASSAKPERKAAAGKKAAPKAKAPRRKKAR